MAKRFDVEIEDLEYANPDGIPLLARLYKPRDAGPFPGVVEVHGCTWTSNDRLTNTPINQPLAESRVVVMVIDFRMPPQAMYPASLKDMNAAVRWLKTNDENYSTRADLVGLLGTSSGGHQAMLSALCPNEQLYLPDGTTNAVPDAKAAFVGLLWACSIPWRATAW